eukprot:662614-Rhodomonas_salina.7
MPRSACARAMQRPVLTEPVVVPASPCVAEPAKHESGRTREDHPGSSTAKSKTEAPAVADLELCCASTRPSSVLTEVVLLPDCDERWQGEVRYLPTHA